jgi:hypothetical protein
MPDGPLNPYAPPAESAATETAGLWSVSGDLLLVQNGASLPPVDLAGDGGTEELAPVAYQFNVASSLGLAHWGVLGGMVGVMALSKHFFGKGEFWMGLVAYAILSRWLGGGTGGGQARITGFASVPSLRAWARRHRWRQRMIWAGLLAVALPNLGLISGVVMSGSSLADMDPLRWVVPSVALGIGLAFGAAVWRIYDSGPVCHARRDGWFHVKGVKPAALVALARRLHEPPPPLRPRAVHPVYQYRLPLRMLARTSRSPWVWLVLAILKTRRSPRLVRQMFAAKEGITLDPAAADPALHRRWQQETQGTALASWTPCHAGRLDSPQRDSRTELVIYASPDRTSFAMVAVIRVAIGAYFNEETELSLRSWTADGRCLHTGSHEAPQPLPADIDYLRSKVGLAAMAELHRQRTEGAMLQAPDDARFRELLTAEAEARRAALEAAGIYGPIEEIELPGDWG